MQNNGKETVGIIAGGGPLAAAVARQLAGVCLVVAFDPQRGGTLRAAGAELLDSLAALGARTRLVLLAGPQAGDVAGFDAALPRDTIVVDLNPGDPAATQARARSLAERGIALVDAPVHCEHLAQFPEEAAILCGGAAERVADVRPLLERICSKVVACGEVGNGHAMHAIVGAIALCNRLVTYECAAMGFRNGLSVADMGTVLNRCSGANSATARVLPAMTQGRRSADTALAETARELAVCTHLARRHGAPALMANQAFNQVLGASRALGADATLDDLQRLVESASGFEFGR